MRLPLIDNSRPLYWVRLITGLIALGSAAEADDRVTIRPAGQSGQLTITGRVDDFTGHEITILTTAGSSFRKYPAREVVEVRTTYTSPHEQARQHLRAGELREAEEQLKAALDIEDRTWVRREILALQVQLALRQGQWPVAATRFVTIARSDPVSPHFRLIPLIWTDTPPTKLSLRDAERWVSSEDRVEQLIGASWLLQSPDSERGLSVLRSLARENDVFIQRLAQAQLWRVRLAEGVPAASEIHRWEHLCEEWPETLRGGPYYLIARAYAARQEWLAASATWLWIPFEYNHRPDLAAEAQWQATLALEAAGDTAAAQRLARDLILQFGDLPPASLAQHWLNDVNSPTSSPSPPPVKTQP